MNQFSTGEYQRRLEAVRARMHAQDFDGLLVSDPANIYYLTGYNAWSFYTPQVLWVPADGPMVFYAREMDALGAWRTAILPRDQVVGYPETLVHKPHTHPMDWVGKHLAASLGARATIGLDLDAHFFSPKGYLALSAALPNACLTDSFELINWVRVIKSQEEIEVMRKAARVTTAAMQAAVAAAGIGVPQNVVAAAIAGAQATGDGDAWGDYPAIVPMLPTGAAADTPHLTWSDQPLAKGDAMVVELAGAHRRYHVPLARTIMLGTPSADLKQLESVVAEGLAAVLDTVRSGVPVVQVAQAWNDALARHSLSKNSRLGYSIGIGFPPDWGERTVSIRSEDESVLQENMTFHLIAGMWMTGYGYEVSESIRVTDAGAECFTSFDRALLSV